MVDFGKMLKKAPMAVPTDPIEIYNTLDLTTVAGPLRPVQEEVLKKWYDTYFEKKDIILKLHTGEGKTLIGMLMLLSRLNKGLGPCIFVCPNRQLAEQASADAKKFGISHELLCEGELPSDFLESKKILITHVQKVFNGLSLFGLDNRAIRIGTFVLDDSHACIDAIKSSFTVKIHREEKLFDTFLRLFETELRKQGEGSYYDIMANPYSSDPLAVPYWAWIDKCEEVLRILMESEDQGNIKFTLPLLRNKLRFCTMYLNGKGIEIVPYYPLIERFTSFTLAKQRILMSATTQDDSFFVRGLGLSDDAIKYPLTSNLKKWSGEKMIIFPSIIDDRLNQDVMRGNIAAGNLGKKKITVLVPGFRIGNEYASRGCNMPSKQDEIKDTLNKMKAGLQAVPTVFANRYDGIDLADDMCRTLVIDSLPVFGSLSDQYEESCRYSSDLVNIKIAQKIEQGLGRSVRGERDYSTILIVGANLVRFMKSSSTRKYFSSQTNKQISIGEIVAEQSHSEKNDSDPILPVKELMLQCLKRNEDWKEYYKTEMDSLILKEQEHPLLDLLVKEREADIALVKEDWPTIFKIYEDISNSLQDNLQEQGWYLQELAKYKSHTSLTEAIKIQQRAFSCNQYVLNPDLIVYKRVKIMDDNRLHNIKNYIANFADYSELKLTIDSVMANLSWGISSKKFEKSIQVVGELLGFGSQRPDNEFKKGPDNLWAMPQGEYLAIECKNEIDLKRASISKSEAGQMEMHCGWFEKEYGTDIPVTYMWVHPKSNLADDAILTHKVFAMTPEKLDSLKKHLTTFVAEFSRYKLKTIEENTIHDALLAHRLTIKDLKNYYCEEVK